MSERLQMGPEATRAVLHLEKYVNNSGLERPLYELVKIRASQINKCAYCLDMHTRDALQAGEDPRRVNILAAWREAPSFFTARERAALSLTEAITLISEDGVPDHVWDGAAAEFSEDDLRALVMGIGAINVWNRLAVATHQDLP